MTGVPAFKRVVVLMFENRSFDHVFGAFPAANGMFENDGQVKPDVYNLEDPTRPQDLSNKIYRPVAITPDIPLEHDFDHNFGNGMMQELFGPGTTGVAAGRPVDAPAATFPPVNSGFVSTIAYNVDPHGTTRNGPQAMSYYEYGSLKVLHTLASHFVLCDNWFCDIPGTTLLNRFFMHTAQTDGSITDDQGDTIGVETIYDRIEKQGAAWRMYAPHAIKDGVGVCNPQIDTRFLADNIQNSPWSNRAITEFASDAAGGNLPTYSFLMCWLPLSITDPHNDTSMHPHSDIRPGENYLAAVYRTLRNSPCWSDTLLIVTFDENGGMYDHVAPPTTIAPNSKTGRDYDSFLEKWCTFDFTVLGPRIPALLISPWLSSGVAHQHCQNTSILRYVEDLIGASPLNARDDHAPKLDRVFAEFGLSSARPDCPKSIAGYPGFPYADGDLGRTYVVPPGTTQEPPPYMADVAKMYRVGQ